MESRTSSSQAKARLLIVAVFVIGFAAGALSLNLYQKFTSGGADKVDPRDRAGLFIQRMDEKMSLSKAQKDQIRQILDNNDEKYNEIRKRMEPFVKDFEPQFDAVRQQSRNAIRAVLTDKQLPQFEKMVEERDRIQQEEREKRRK
jgi:hypothetical protein